MAESGQACGGYWYQVQIVMALLLPMMRSIPMLRRVIHYILLLCDHQYMPTMIPTLCSPNAITHTPTRENRSLHCGFLLVTALVHSLRPFFPTTSFALLWSPRMSRGEKLAPSSKACSPL